MGEGRGGGWEERDVHVFVIIITGATWTAGYGWNAGTEWF